jgi:hypothetical protein
MHSSHNLNLIDKISYENLLIINLVDKDPNFILYAKKLKNKWERNHPGKKCLLWDSNNFSDQNFKLNDHDGKYQIYVICHAFPGAISMKGSREQRYDAEELSHGLKKCMGNNPVIINLISCAAGRGSDEVVNNPFDGFAARLHQELNNQNNINITKDNYKNNFAGMDIPVIARTHRIYIIDDGSKQTANLEKTDKEVGELVRLAKSMNHDVSEVKNLALYKQPGSKIMFIKDENGNQAVADAYYISAKRNALKALLNAAASTKVETKKERLSKMVEDFQDKSLEYIRASLQAELDNKDSPLWEHSNFISSFYKDSDSIVTLKNLVEDMNQLFRSRHTFSNLKINKGK